MYGVVRGEVRERVGQHPLTTTLPGPGSQGPSLIATGHHWTNGFVFLASEKGLAVNYLWTGEG